MVELARRITASSAFASGVPMLIVGNAMAVALQAVEVMDHHYHDGFEVFFWVSELLFIAEIIVRMVAAGSVRAFWADGWNRFDFAIVAASLVPVVGVLAPLGRLLRLLRVLRLFSAFDALRDVVEEDHVAGPAVGPLLVLLGVVGFIATLSGHTLFAELDPAHWGDLFVATRSVFYLAVLAEVAPIVGKATDAAPASLAFFIAFYVTLVASVLQVVTATLRPRRSA